MARQLMTATLALFVYGGSLLISSLAGATTYEAKVHKIDSGHALLWSTTLPHKGNSARIHRLLVADLGKVRTESVYSYMLDATGAVIDEKSTDCLDRSGAIPFTERCQDGQNAAVCSVLPYQVCTQNGPDPRYERCVGGIARCQPDMNGWGRLLDSRDLIDIDLVGSDVSSVALASDDAILAVGRLYLPNWTPQSPVNLWVGKLNRKSSAPLWQRQIELPDSAREYGRAILPTNDHDAIAATDDGGAIVAVDTGNLVTILRLGPDGVTVWEKALPYQVVSYHDVSRLVKSGSGYILITNRTERGPAAISFITDDGQVRSRTLVALGSARLKTLVATTDGGVLVGGRGEHDLPLLAQIDKDGVVLWKYDAPVDIPGTVTAAALTNDGGAVFATWNGPNE